MERLLDAMSILSIVLVLVVLYSVRRSHIRVEYSVSWIAAATILLVVISDLKDANIAMAQRLAIVEFQLQNRNGR